MRPSSCLTVSVLTLLATWQLPLFAQATSVIGNLPGMTSGAASGTTPSGTPFSGVTPSSNSSLNTRMPRQTRPTPLSTSQNDNYPGDNNPSFNPSSVEASGSVSYGPNGSQTIFVDRTIVYGDDTSNALVDKYKGDTTSVGNSIAQACAQLAPKINKPGDCINIEVPVIQGDWRSSWTSQMGITQGPQNAKSVVVFYPQSFALIHCATASYTQNTPGNDPDFPPPAPLDPNPLTATKQLAVAAEGDPDHNTLMSYAGQIICYYNRPCPYQAGLQPKAPAAILSPPPPRPGLIGAQGSPRMVQFCTPPDKIIGLPNAFRQK